MVWFLGGTAVLCLLYYIIIVIYSGVSTSFALIWPCLAIFWDFWRLDGGLAASMRAESRVDRRFRRDSMCGGISDSGDHGGFDRLERHYGDGTAGGLCDRAGARVRGAKISNSLKQRLDRAIEYSEEYPNTVLVLSGGKGPGEGDQRGAGDVRIFTVQRDSGG
ncbi:MAG: hypothetical protein ACLR8P_11855 [Clostridium fessum]